MKKLMIIAMILMLNVAPKMAFAEKIDVTVNGLVCSFCAVAIEKTFKKKNVENIDVNLSERYVRFELDKSNQLSDLEITKIINDAGYDVVEVNRSE